ncbi:hypothetical protein HK103_004249 [Boothiomyces macroporosus]|uniref:C2H2-type domain-containing protein n=1 Tax=Boothiomyces macroporosus TaxID=261099 RepID=A0AAD5Y3J3_9FUNG|nr:hypothetical protein HK103_004249 [Boothiomyces macroporosus]KAJ3309035.1 hypothetical protein HDV04_000541 [Boothiomyces sp. JEL0838]
MENTTASLIPNHLYGTYEQHAMIAFQHLTQKQQQIQIAAKVALDTVNQEMYEQEFMETSQEFEKPQEEEEEEEDFEESSSNFKQRYTCPRPNCSKVYKNRNGLKYHLQKGSCRISQEPTLVLGPDGQLVQMQTPVPSTPNSPLPRERVFKPMMEFGTDPDAYNRVKPFWCRLCTKRYKNPNGLKYHAKVEHPEWDFEEIKGM